MPLRPAPRFSDPDPEDLEAWQRGMAALNRMPASIRGKLLEHLDESRQATLVELRGRHEHTDRLRWWPEAAIDNDVGERLGAHVVMGIPDEPAAALLIGRLDPEGHTILYGTGGSGKGTLTSQWAIELATTGHRVVIVDYENHPGEWSRRLTGLGGRELTDRILHVAPLTAAWSGKKGAIWKQAADLRELAQAWEATYVIIDSIVPACGATDALKPEAASQYAGALEYIGLPVLSLAHVTKAEQMAYPFGSVFWHNLARTTWSLQADGETAILSNRKANNHRRGGSFNVEITWGDDLPREVWERPFTQVMADRITEALKDGARTVEAIVTALNEELEEGQRPAKPDTVRATLRRYASGDARRFDVTDKQWSLAQ